VRERVPEVGTLKAIGAGNGELAVQFLAEAVALSALGGLGAIAAAAPLAAALRRFFVLAIGVDARMLALTALACVALAALGSVYPVVRAARLSPVEALRAE
jgi:putative ABC transport system permease protein